MALGDLQHPPPSQRLLSPPAVRPQCFRSHWLCRVPGRSAWLSCTHRLVFCRVSRAECSGRGAHRGTLYTDRGMGGNLFICQSLQPCWNKAAYPRHCVVAFLGMQPGTALWDKAGDGVAHLSVARRMGMLAYWGV